MIFLSCCSQFQIRGCKENMILLLAVCSVLVASAASQQAPTVIISQGTVIGARATDGEYNEFYGIPYAESTSGINRFKAPLPAPNLESNFVANRTGIKCVHALGVGYEGTEDCLVANIFTPVLDINRRLPVMVWIKGKEFDRGSLPELSFRNFVERDVVVVSLNYRESILGFLCLGTETAPGNAGLKDIIAGLKWVQANIAQFGGNPEDITLFGHGSGAAAVDLITLSPMAEGLVHKAIAQSGSALAPWAVSRDNLEYALQVAEALGHEITDIQQLSDVFTRTSVSALMGVINELDLSGNSLAFAPCVERQVLAGVEPFLVKTPALIIRDAEFLKIPVIFGYVDNEGTIRAEEAVEDNWLERMEESLTEFIQPDLKFNTADEKTEIAQRIRTFYFGEDGIDETEFLKYHGEAMMLVSTIREVKNRKFASPSTPIYLYQFSYSGTLGEQFVGPGPINVKSAAHSEELAYMFYNTPATGNTETTNDNDLVIGNILAERWTSFAKTGDPNPEAGTSQVTWLPFSSLTLNYIRVLSNVEILPENSNYEVQLQSPHFATINFWDQIYATHFLDAQSNWEIKDRVEDYDDPTTVPPPTDEDTDDPTTTEELHEGTTLEPPTEVTTLEPPTEVTTPEPPTEATTPEPPTEVTIPELPTEVTTPEPPTEVTTPEPPTEVTTPEPPTEVTTPEPPTEVTTPEPPTEVTTPEPPTEVTTPEPPTEVTTPEPPTEVTTPEPPTEVTTPEPPTEVTTPEPPTEVTTPEPPTEVTTPEPPTDVTTPEPPSEVTTPEPPTEVTTPEPPTEVTTPEPPTEVTTPEPPTEVTTPEPPTEVTTPEPPTEVTTPEPEESSEEEITPEPTEGSSEEEITPEPTQAPDSASSAVAYTFLIVSLFSLLSHFHSSLILS